MGKAVVTTFPKITRSYFEPLNIKVYNFLVLGDEGISQKSEVKATSYLPEAAWINPDTSVAVVSSLPEDAAGFYDWVSKEISVSASKVDRWAGDVYQAQRKSTAEQFGQRIQERWDTYEEDTKMSAVYTYLYLRALNRSNNDLEELKRNFAIEIVAHESRHAYDDEKGYRDQLGTVGPVEIMAFFAQMEESPVYERNLYVMSMEPYWMNQTEGYEPVSIHDKVGIVAMKTMIGFIEEDVPGFSEQPVEDQMKHIAFLPPEDFKALCGEIKDKFESYIYETE